MATNKSVILIIVVVFLGFYLMQDPTGLAAFAKDVAGAAGKLASTLFEAIIDFLEALRD